MGKRADFIEKNLDTLRKLVKNGDVPTKLLTDYRMYKVYKSYKGGSKMTRYQMTAEDFGVCTSTIIRAVGRMEKMMR